MAGCGFRCAMLTDHDVERGIDYHSVIAWGSKKACIGIADAAIEIPGTASVRVVRDRDGAVVYERTA